MLSVHINYGVKNIFIILLFKSPLTLRPVKCVDDLYGLTENA